ncbi:MAG: alpha/beta fold hydrolase [Actinobacteria bacterium]|nr:alpha/beta fold hydrolase [Actinomycetota bacterium]
MFASVNGTRIFFDVDGARAVWKGDVEVERPVMVLLPGGPGASHMHYKRPRAGFDRLKPFFQMIYIDWRGAARSDPAPSETLTLEQVVEDVESIRQMLGMDKWVVLGASGGGIWAPAYASAHPDAVTHLIVLHAPARSDYFAETAESMARRAGVTDEDAISIYRRFVGGDLLEPVEQWAQSLRNTILQVQNALYTDPKKHPDVVKARTKSWNTMPSDELMKEFDVSRWYLNDFAKSYRVSDIAKTISAPTLIITGETDPVALTAQSEEIHQAIEGSELFIHPGGHMPHGDEQGPFFDKILDFLSRHGIDTEPVES